jgi:DNA-binding protein HU-beta
MTKADLIAAVADKTGLTKAAAEKAVGAVTESITETLVSGETVNLVGFGAFRPKHRAARKGRNPKTGEPMMIDASNSVRFTVGAALKKAVN